MKIIGIDPGIAITGWGIINHTSGQCRAVSFGCIKTKAEDSPESRLILIYKAIKKIVRKHHPDQAAIEKLFFNTNAKTAFSVGEARGVTLLALASENLPIFQYTPLEVKIAISGYGRADKNQIETMVKTLLELKYIPSPDDISDALAVAITHGSVKKPT